MIDALPPIGRVLLLGASGLVGSQVLERLAGVPGVEVCALSRYRKLHLEAPNITWLRADLRDAGSCVGLFEGVDFVLMMAGVVATAPVLSRDPIGPVLDNLRISQNVFEAAWRARVRSVVWLSSATGYPERATALREEEMFEAEPPPAWTLLGAPPAGSRLWRLAWRRAPRAAPRSSLSGPVWFMANGMIFLWKVVISSRP